MGQGRPSERFENWQLIVRGEWKNSRTLIRKTTGLATTTTFLSTEWGVNEAAVIGIFLMICIQ